MIEVLILIFILSVIAWARGDNSMAWFVVLVIVIFAVGAIVSGFSS